MSRSYRKAWIVDNAWKYWGKRFASRRIRRISKTDKLSNNCNYKKHYQQYDISDYKLRCINGDSFYNKYKRK